MNALMNRLPPRVRSLIAKFRETDVVSLGAQLSYYLILAFFPFLIFLISLIGHFRLSSDTLMDILVRLLPNATGSSIRDVVNEVTANQSGALLSFGLLGSIWSASGAVNAMIKGLNKAYGEQEHRAVWRVRGISLLATLVLAAIIIVSMALLVFGETIQQELLTRLGAPEHWSRIWSVLQIVVPVVVLFCVFLLLYRMTPDRRLTWSEVIPGSVFAAIGWIASSLLFSFYVNNFGNYSKTYGSLGGVIVLLIWLYLSSIILLVGGILNAEFANNKQQL
ncbi:YihY/virulence factor BrkB family protein [Cohnella thailandensis]|uniref:YihY/virulence factor BrkB family protein n=1 Tax=Cohnella thailandensis TaxID=557557 RepID=A0A841SRN4_9BACL|nr:YihY/virulence factor BrkB family protein [Cohnella thailandensis]MBB6633872.1 YihY/virulence factor BrkB family protein [Cohnella thailandensis]MBP1972555.1 membrane protein [Cohnella thailandensis]